MEKPTALNCLGLLCLATFLATALQAQTSGLSSLETQERPVPLPLDQAFPWYLSEPEPGRWTLTWNPAPGHYLYRHAFAFSLQYNPDSEPQALSFEIPEGLQKTDQFFGDIQAYYDSVTVSLELPENLPEGSQLWLEYQGCAEWGFCYPPQRQSFSVVP